MFPGSVRPSKTIAVKILKNRHVRKDFLYKLKLSRIKKNVKVSKILIVTIEIRNLSDLRPR